MRLKPAACTIATFLLLAGALCDQTLQASGWNFDNQNVLSLLKEGRSDSAIIARIAEVQTVIFRFEADDLLALRNAGASPGVISAMLARARQSSGSNFASNVMPAFKNLKAETLTLFTQQGQLELDFSRGEFIKEGDLSNPAAHLHLEYPGQHASVRTTDQRPSLLIRFESDPTKHYYIAKLSPSMKKNVRGIKINEHSFKPFLPDRNWMIAYTATKEEKGVWRITPKAGLEPGEYGLLDGVRLFGFGVDLQEKTDSPSVGSR